jgi:SAM-dependent methyltransferase
MTNIQNIYNQMLTKGSADYEKVGWGSLESQLERFRILSDIGNLNKCSVLDVGCGLGGLFNYLNKKNLDVNYTGVDINENMIKTAKKNYPDAKFYCEDICSHNSILGKKSFDYVFLSGALNLSEDNHENNIERILKKIFSISDKGIAVNFLSIYSDYITPGEYYSNPENVLKLGFSLSKKIVLRHDYMPHDFSLYIYK